ncbi:sterol desaturase family protein [Ginsengibacter hankyongi]|uniref:Sterol desaturase family protein n=1 Tax=Ginsengibacter hankyongi TaxID=2607284 RepID=A0A5J5IE25_9BACT|nr:sterol desaturase family protein [Ginsengibacter hankyongi]KAA9034653.1 sterol desaturase family protein [Ginsengibacter hankyongi]
MRHIFHFLTYSSDETEALIFASVLFICWNIENIAGLAGGYKKWNHAFLNVQFIITGIAPQFMMGLLFVKTMQWTGQHHVGLLYHLLHVKNAFILFLVSFVLLDFGEYIYHVIMHKVNTLWMFHAVHHSDYVVDVSTTLREHPGENIIRNCFTLLWIFLSGALFWMVFLRQLIQITSNLLVHMNCRLPDKLDDIVSTVFITPNLHQVHHHYQKPYTDCNYGDVLSIWDRMFGTLCRLPYEEIVFGVDMLDKNNSTTYFSLMKMPFEKYFRQKKD